MTYSADLVVPETEDKVNLILLPIIECMPIAISPNEDNTVLLYTIKLLKVSPAETKLGTPVIMHSFLPITEEVIVQRKLYPSPLNVILGDKSHFIVFSFLS